MNKIAFFLLSFTLALATTPVLAEGAGSLLDDGTKADFIVTAGYTSGGDDLIDVQYERGGKDKITAGGEILLGVGVVFLSNENFELQLAANYHFDDVSAENGDASFERYPIDILIFRRADRHRFGGGLTMHLSPSAEIDIDGTGRETVNFETAYGVVLEYDYQVLSKVWLGLRYTHISYAVDSIFRNSDIDGSNFGLTVNFRF